MQRLLNPAEAIKRLLLLRRDQRRGSSETRHQPCPERNPGVFLGNLDRTKPLGQTALEVSDSGRNGSLGLFGLRFQELRFESVRSTKA